MRALIQRVSSASVEVDGKVTGGIGPGLLILLGVRRGDGPKELVFVAEKCANLRIFEDEDGKMNRSVVDIGGEVLVVSQFTLYGDTRRGRRPGFSDAAPPAVSEPMYEAFIQHLRTCGLPVKTGIFGAMMNVSLVNDGPVTLMIEKEAEG